MEEGISKKDKKMYSMGRHGDTYCLPGGVHHIFMNYQLGIQQQIMYLIVIVMLGFSFIVVTTSFFVCL